MHTSFAKLLCVAALASTAFAQSLSFVSPKAATVVKAGETLTLELKQAAPANGQTIQEVALVIGVTGSAFDGATLGNSPYTGVFTSKSTDSAGNKYGNVSVVVPDYFNGAASVNLGHFYLSGEYATAHLEFASLVVQIEGASG